jgi:hypothetical protein
MEVENDARPMVGNGVSYGDCVEARRRAAADPALAVDRLPSPVRQKPVPLSPRPANVTAHANKNGAVVKVRVIVDTLGRADMKTFKVDTASHPWFVENLKTVLPQWRFTPAVLAGCKVRRVYKFSATKSKPAATKG